jgi:hypothetical protein
MPPKVTIINARLMNAREICPIVFKAIIVQIHSDFLSLNDNLFVFDLNLDCSDNRFLSIKKDAIQMNRMQRVAIIM